MAGGKKKRGTGTLRSGKGQVGERRGGKDMGEIFIACLEGQRLDEFEVVSRKI